MNPVQPYAGQNQQRFIHVPASIWHREQWEEGCWVLPPYAAIFPGGEHPETAIVPPPIYKTDLWSAMQTWPM